jgi:hypothetical protein
MIQDIQKEIIEWVEEKEKGSFISVKMIFDKFFIDRENFSVGLPGYFQGWVHPVNNLLRKYSQVMKVKDGWIKL